MKKELKNARVVAEVANSAKTEFLANMSHGLRTPMHAILNYSKFGVKNIDQAKNNIDKLHKYFSKIHLSGERLLNLMNDILDLSKLESGKMSYLMENHDLKFLTEETVSEYQSLLDEKHIALEIKKTGLTQTIFDYEKIGQVVRNLISNAMKFAPIESKIIIHIIQTPFQHESPDQPALLFSITDQGVGIPEEDLDSVFEKFVQSSIAHSEIKSTGLGLSICKEIIAAHNGKIWAKNHPEGGAIFSFFIPRD